MRAVQVLLCLAGISAATYGLVQPEEVFAWKQVSFSWPDGKTREDALTSGDYVPENNLPLGLARWKDKLFVTVPRWKSGVASSLNTVSLNSPINRTTALIPYPTWKDNLLPKSDNEKLEDSHIVSTFRVAVDECDRLWVMDTGLADILGSPRQISPPAILIFDLNTDKLIHRYTLKPTDLKGEDSFWANIVVDVSASNCSAAHAYLPDLGGYGLVVYSLAQDDSWRVTHNFFHFDPLQGDLTVGGINFQWTDGVFGLALGKPDQEGNRHLYFHALASTDEFSVDTKVLQNKTLATSPQSYSLFKREGNKGANSQTSASVFDQESNVLFMTQLNKNGVACWNPNKPLVPENVALVLKDDEKCVFANDMKLDNERNLWVLSDKMPTFLYKQLSPEEVNYRILKIKVDDAIAGTPCAS